MHHPHSSKPSDAHAHSLPEGGMTDRQETLLVVVMLVFFIGFAGDRLLDGLAMGQVFSTVFMVGLAALVPLTGWMLWKLFGSNRKP